MSDDADLKPAPPNRIGAETVGELREREEMYVARRMVELQNEPIQGEFDYAHLQAIHEHLMQDAYDWAGQQRTEDVFKNEEVLGGARSGYAAADDISETFEEGMQLLREHPMTDLRDPKQAAAFAAGFRRIWEAHPFNDGNTRATTIFVEQYAEVRGQTIEFSGKSEGFLRNALVVHWYDREEMGHHLERAVQRARTIGLDREAQRTVQLQSTAPPMVSDSAPVNEPEPTSDRAPGAGQIRGPTDPEPELEP